MSQPPTDPPDIPNEPAPQEFHVTGGPGCGKTRYLSSQIDIAAQRGLKPLVLSLTRNTAAEAASRNPDLPTSQISTIHSLCYQAVGGANIADSPDGIRAWNEEHFLRALSETRERDEFNPRANPASGPQPDFLLADYQRLRATLQSLPDEGPLADFAREWDNWCRDNNSTDFNGLFDRCIQERIPPPGNPGIIFVDEAQDLTPLELKLLRLWSAAGIPLVLAGDPNQNLYQWRGSDSSALEHRDLIPAHHRVLSQSRRVPLAIHDVTLRWFSQCPTKPTIDYQPRQHPGDFNRIPATWHEPDQTADLAAARAQDGHRVMILSSCAYMLQPTIAYLRRNGIPFHNPWRANPDWNPNAPDREKVTPAQRVKAFIRFDPTSSDAPNDAILWASLMEMSAVFKEGRHGLTQLQRLEPDTDANAQAQLLNDVMTPHAIAAAAGSDLRWLTQNLPRDCPDDFPYMINMAIRYGAPVLDEQPRIVVGTIHSVKGAECDYVHLYPDLPLPAMREWLGPPQQQAAIYRQFYVAMTRPREAVTLCDPAGTMAIDL